MVWDNVPWLIGGGAEHSPEVARSLAYMALGGAEGVGESGDLRVTATATPGGTVDVAQGTAAINSRSSSNPQEAYVGRVPNGGDNVPIAATGSGGGRSDMVVALVKDPYLAGSPWATPADPTVGPYIGTAVLSGVPSTATKPADVAAYSGYTAIPLARIDIPANTATITQAMIVDLRSVARPRTLRKVGQYFSTNVNYVLSNAQSVPWPQYSIGSVAIPSWATIVHARAELHGPYLRTGAAAGYLRFRLNTTDLMTPETYYNEQVVGDSRLHFFMAGDIVIPPQYRGTVQPLYIDGRKSAGSGNLVISTDALAIWDLQFDEAAA